MSTRTDIHRPAALVTEDYEYLYSWDSRQPGCLIGIAQSEAWREWHAAGPVLPEVSSNQCTHCGAHLRYVALLRYIPTGQYLYVGETCLANRFDRATVDFQKLRKAAQLDREKQRIKQAWIDYKAANAGFDWNFFEASENSFVKDVIAKGRKYGALSTRQLEAIYKAVVRDAERAANPKVEDIKVPVISGDKLTVEGVIVSIKSQPGYAYNTTDLKVTVKVTTDAGVYLLWGTLPRSLEAQPAYDQWGYDAANSTPGAEVGDTIRFVANVVQGDRDPSFGFFKRPRNAEVVTRGA